MQPDLLVSTLPVAALIPYAENVRTHSSTPVVQIAAPIAEFGFVNTVLVNGKGVLIAGHGRVRAGKRLALATVPALRLADNQIALNAGWGEALLVAETAGIRDEAVVDLDTLGFPEMALNRLLAIANAGFAEDAAESPEPPANPVTRSGDRWFCGDATVLADVQQAPGGRSLADMSWTDPTHNIAYQGGTAAKLTIANDPLGAGIPDFLRSALANLLSVSKGACYVCRSSREWTTLHRAWHEAGSEGSTTIIWAKNIFVLGRADYPAAPRKTQN